MTNDNGLAVIEHVNGTALEMYQDRNEVRELTDRLLSLHPAAAEVGKPGMIAVAQLALLVGASPLPGTNEIHVWKSGNKIQFQLGINFYRRKADEQGGVLWAIQPRQMRDDERAEYGVPQGQIAAICKAVRREDMEKYVGMGFKANQIWDMVGRVGIGTAGPGEAKAGRTAVWTALKRSEVDLYRALYPAMMQRIEEAQRSEKVTISSGPDWNEITSNEIDDMFSYNTSATAPVEYIDLDTGEIEQPDEGEYEEVVHSNGNGNGHADDNEPINTSADWSMDFLSHCAANINRYSGNPHKAKQALMKHFDNPPVTKADAKKQFEWLKEHAAQRDTEEVQAAQQGGLFDDESPSIEDGEIDAVWPAGRAN